MSTATPHAAPSLTSVARPGAARGEVRSIQYLRGLAAFGVLVFHAAERAGGAFGVGAAGVDIFFVISGFIMWVVTCERPQSPARFLVRRAQRILPLYWLTTLAVAAAALAIPGAFPAMQPTLAHVLQSLLFIPHHDSAGLIAPLIVPGWTLNYEMFFYLLFALALLASVPLRVGLVTIALVALVAVRPLGDVREPLWATYTDPILLEFAAGLWLGRAWTRASLPGPRAGWTMVGLGLAGFVATALSGVDVSAWRLVLWGAPAFLIVAGAVTLESHGIAPRGRALHALGDASYSVYLVHGLAISAAVRGLAAMGVQSGPVLFAVALLAGLAGGFATYALVERPITRRLSRRSPASK